MQQTLDQATEIGEQFWRDGIVILPGFFDREPMRDLAAELAAAVATDPNRAWGGGPDYARERETRVQVWSGKDLPHVKTAFADPRLPAISEAICGAGYVESGEGIFSTPRDGLQGWHQDTRARGRDQFELNRIVFPSDVAAEQGALYYVPGTHLGPDLPRGGNQEPIPGERTALPTAGTLVLMHTRCFHRVGINRTDRPRTQCNSRVRPAAAPDNLGATPVFRTGPWNFSTNRAE